jgi:hypothetical protein
VASNNLFLKVSIKEIVKKIHCALQLCANINEVIVNNFNFYIVQVYAYHGSNCVHDTVESKEFKSMCA